MSIYGQVENLRDRGWRGEDREGGSGRDKRKKTRVLLMKDLLRVLAPNLLAARSRSSDLSRPDLHFVYLLNENNILHKTVALKLELERASQSPGGVV